MRRLLTWALAAVLPALLVSAMSIGCGGNDKKDGGGGDNTKKTNKPPPKVEKTELSSKGWGTLKGRVVVDKPPSNLDAEDAKYVKSIKDVGKDVDTCLMGSAVEKGDQQWILAKDKKGVANVFVWLQPPDDDHVFKIDWEKKPWKEMVVIDQPHCAFLPHAQALFVPDDESKKGQFLRVMNSADINHNTNWSGGDDNKGDNKIIPKKDHFDIMDLRPSSTRVILKCNIHTYMSGVVRVFNHPYIAVTDEDGNFEIKNAPADADVRVMVWHEAADTPDTGKEVEKVKLADGKTTEGKSYTINAK